MFRAQVFALLVLATPWVSAGAPNWSSQAASSGASVSKEAAAQRYLDAMPVSAMVMDTAQKMAATLPKHKRASFVETMTRTVDIRRIEAVTLDAMVRTFTVEELNAFADFYSSPVGKSAMAKFGQYMSLVMPVMQQEIVKAAKAAR